MSYNVAHALTVLRVKQFSKLSTEFISQNIFHMSADQLFPLKVLSPKKTCLVILLLGTFINSIPSIYITGRQVRTGPPNNRKIGYGPLKK